MAFSVRTEAGLAALNEQLAVRSYLGGSAVSSEDFARAAELRAAPDAAFPHARRWFAHVKYLQQTFPGRYAEGAPAAGGGGKADRHSDAEAKAAAGRAKAQAAKAAAEAAKPKGGGGGGSKGGKDQAQLEGKLIDAVVGKVCTRFPPEPSGFMHIGHAKAALLNYHYAKEYKGKFILRFDDTNPTKEKSEFEESMIQDMARLNIIGDQVTHTSDYFDQLQAKMEELIKKGIMYCDNTEMLEMRDMRDKGIESKFRSQPVAENLKMWAEMLKGSPEGLKCCVRGKLDMQEKNKCLRDPVFYRCKTDMPHHRTGTKYKAYPTYDFACPIVDSIEGVTHPLRTIEYRDRDPMYQWVLKVAGYPPKHVTEFSKSQFMYTILSKRKLQLMVDCGAVEGWDDPRFPTVQGVLRRGMTVEGLLEFCLTQGASKATNLMSWDKIWAINKQKIDPVTARYAAIEDSEKVELVLSNGPAEPTSKMEAKHPKNPELGERLLTFAKSVWMKRADLALLADNEEVTLMHWGNAIIQKLVKGKDGKITKAEGKLHLEGDVKSTKWKLHWVAKVENTTPVVLRRYDTVLNKEKIEETDDIKDCINWNSKTDSVATGDPMLSTVQKGTKLQLERTGYFVVDQVPARPGEPLVFVEIPDGKAKSMAGEQKLEAGKAISTLNKKEQARQAGGAAPAKGSPKKAAAPAPAAAADSPELEAVKKQIAEKKAALKAGGMSGGQINKDPEVQKLVEKMQALKAAPPPAAASPKKAAAPAPAKKGAPAAKAADRPLDDVARMDFRVGKIVEVWAHPEADKLWCEKIDLGEGAPRTIASGLREHISQEGMMGARVVVLANLKSRKMKGFDSQGMVLGATGADGKVELLTPPAGAAVGERVTFDGYSGDADEKLNEKTGKAPLVEVLPHLSTDGKLQACFKGIPFMTSKGAVTVASVTNAGIK